MFSPYCCCFVLSLQCRSIKNRDIVKRCENLSETNQNAARPPLQHPMFSSRQYPGLSEDDSSPRNQSPQPEEDKSAEALDMTKTDDYEETDVNMNKTTPLKLLAQTVIEQVIFLSVTSPCHHSESAVVEGVLHSKNFNILMRFI